MESTKKIIKKVKLIEEYCHTHGQWPLYDRRNNETKQWEASYRLRRWLYYTGYMSGNFKYAHIVDENGVSLKTILDNLFEEYSMTKQQRIDKRMQKWVDLLEEYCVAYGKWPQVKRNDEKNAIGIIEQKLSSWLITSGYMSDNFKYAHVVDENGNSLKDRLDRLYQQYYKDKTTRMEDNKKIWVDLIEEYCCTYQEWPGSTNFNDKTKDGITAAQLRTWLGNSGYMSGNFKYAHIVDENGITLQQRLDKLFSQYGNGRGAVLRWIEALKEYLTIYQKWPAKNNDKDKTRNGITSAMIYDWLHKSGYLTINFKYAELMDENEINLKDKLDTLLAIFADSHQIIKLDNHMARNLNLLEAKDNDRLGIYLYYLVIQLKLSYENQEQEKFQYFKTLLNSKLKDNYVNLNVEELILNFRNSSEERIDFYYNKWKYCIEKNREMAVLFRYLLEYEKAFYTDSVKEKDKRKKK